VMTEKDKKEMIASAKKIKEICTGSNCEGCPFETAAGIDCLLNVKLPEFWELGGDED